MNEYRKKTHKLNFNVSPYAEENMQDIMRLTHRQRGDMIEEVVAFYLYTMREMSDDFLRIRANLLQHQIHHGNG